MDGTAVPQMVLCWRAAYILIVSRHWINWERNSKRKGSSQSFIDEEDFDFIGPDVCCMPHGTCAGSRIFTILHQFSVSESCPCRNGKGYCLRNELPQPMERCQPSFPYFSVQRHSPHHPARRTQQTPRWFWSYIILG